MKPNISPFTITLQPITHLPTPVQCYHSPFDVARVGWADLVKPNVLTLAITTYSTFHLPVACQGSCYFSQAAFFRRTMSSRIGLSHMTTGYKIRRKTIAKKPAPGVFKKLENRLESGARSRSRTGTAVSSRGILSPLCLPISPSGPLKQANFSRLREWLAVFADEQHLKRPSPGLSQRFQVRFATSTQDGCARHIPQLDGSRPVIALW